MHDVPIGSQGKRQAPEVMKDLRRTLARNRWVRDGRNHQPSQLETHVTTPTASTHAYSLAHRHGAPQHVAYTLVRNPRLVEERATARERSRRMREERAVRDKLRAEKIAWAKGVVTGLVHHTATGVATAGVAAAGAAAVTADIGDDS